MTTTIREQRYATQTEAQWYPVTLSAGSNVAIAGIAGEQVYVYVVILSATSAQTATFFNGATAFSGAMPFTGMALDLEIAPMICSTGNNFNITSSGNAAGMIFAKVA
jgi:hypothetical protein